MIKRTDQIHDKEKPYDQDAIWTELTTVAPADFDRALDIAIRVLDNTLVKAETIPISFIIHLLFDRNITPQGSLIFDQVTRGQLRTGQKQERLSVDHLRARGYSVLPNGEVQTVGDIPVGPFYNTLVEWGVERYALHRMTKPISIDVNRKGNPLFMDNNMVAIGAIYSDMRWVKPSLELLDIYCREGVKGDTNLKPVGRIVNLSLFVLLQGI